MEHYDGFTAEVVFDQRGVDEAGVGICLHIAFDIETEHDVFAVKAFVGGHEAVDTVSIVGVVAFENIGFGSAFGRHHFGIRVCLFPCCPSCCDNRDLFEGPPGEFACDCLADELDERAVVFVGQGGRVEHGVGVSVQVYGVLAAGFRKVRSGGVGDWRP